MIELMEKVEYQALRKCTGTYRRAVREKVLAITGVEPLDVKLNSMQARWLARTIQNPTAAGELLPASWGSLAAQEAAGQDWDNWGLRWTVRKKDGYGSVLEATARKLDLNQEELEIS